MATNKKTPSRTSQTQKTGSKSLRLSFTRLLLSAFIWLIVLCIAGGMTIAAAGAIAYATGYKNIPDMQRLRVYEPKLPLRIFTADGILLAEYSEEKREFVPIDQIPQVLKDALLAVEDAKFYEHIGIDYKGLFRATLVEIFRPEGASRQGASTITMQLAREFFLTKERTYIRKFYEILTTLRIESTLTKDEILEIYMNQIFLGHRSYGFATAANTYYGKKLNELTLGEAAMLAGLPQAPTTNNPITNMKNARTRQLHVLNRMRDIRAITQEQYDQAIAEPIKLRQPTPVEMQIHAEHAADQAQQMILDQFKSDAYTSGINVYTTIQSTHQKAAYQALRNGLITYDKRHYYRGPEGIIALPSTEEELKKALADVHKNFPDNEELQTSVVLSVAPKEVIVTRDGVEKIIITGKGLEPVQSGLVANAKPEIRIEAGSIIRIHQRDENNWDITQIPDVEGSLVALDPQTGAIYAMVGGFDYARSKFNHSTQAWRQPGSSFKPLVYSAALERGVTANTILNDAPIIVRLPSGPWSPKNFGGGFAGRVPMHNALAYSRNIPAILVIDAITPEYAQQWISRFGLEPSKHPANLSMVLGTGSVTPL
ncbi:MAG: penicillin-binding protein 1A, partial [Saezia sp.]